VYRSSISDCYHLTVPEVRPRRLSSPTGTRQLRSTNTSPVLAVSTPEVTGSSVHRSRSLNLGPALIGQSVDMDMPTVDQCQRPDTATASSRTQSPAFLHIVGLEVGRDGKFALMSTSSIIALEEKQPTPLPRFCHRGSGTVLTVSAI